MCKSLFVAHYRFQVRVRAIICLSCQTNYSKRIHDKFEHYTALKDQQTRMRAELFGQHDKVHAEIEQLGRTLDPGDLPQSFISCLVTPPRVLWC
jgi:hypothetical protein